ncbi:MAG TPA: AAA family ATPase [Pyrinomonadaceae bacterium]|nr:AAA family ATPase [Pyrinomonadaceae bacterium]
MINEADEIFLGREQQLSDFLALLKRFFEGNSAEDKPPVMLIHGLGGIGKSTLLREYKALAQRNYSGEYHLLSIDWQLERQQLRQAFSSDASKIDPRVLFHTLNQRAGDSIDRWKTDSNEYVTATRKIHEAARTLAKLSSKGNESTRTAPLPEDDLSVEAANVVSSVVPAALGPLAKMVEPLTKELIRYGFSEVTPRLMEAMIPHIKKRHEHEIELLLDSNNYIARALGEAFRQVSAKRHLLVTFDTYEIIDELDPLVRVLIKKAGARVAWVIVGRHDLFDTRSNTSARRLDGYREENRESYLVTTVDLRALALEDIRQYFRLAAPERPVLDDEKVRRVDLATSAIPLAIKLAADIWKTTGNIEDIITSEGLTEDVIVDEMVGRYEQHCVDLELDRRTLAALAMADGDPQILKAMLLPELDGNEDRYEEHISYIRHRYSAVQRLSVREPRLHDHPARFFSERLRFEDKRSQAWVKSFNQKAITCLCNRINELINYHRSLQELCEDEDYVTACIKVANYLFWLDPNRGMAWVAARYVEGLAYSTPLREGLLDVLGDWRPYLTAILRRSLLVLERSEKYTWRLEEHKARRKLLEGDAKRGWLTDTLIDNRHEQEREKIRLLFAADSFVLAGDSKAALESMSQAAVGEISPAISKRIAVAARSMRWRANEEPELVEQALKLAIKVEPGNTDNWGSMGLLLGSVKRYEEAEEFFARTTKMESNSYVYWLSRGNNLTWLRQYEKAIECHNQASELRPEDPEAWVSLGNDHAWLSQYEMAIEYYKKAIELRADDQRPWIQMAHAHTFLRQYDIAIEYHLKAIGLEHDNPGPWRQLALLMTLLTRDSEADVYIKRSVELEPNNHITLRVVGMLHMMRGRRNEAVNAFQASIASGEEFPSPYQYWARILYRENELELCAEKLIYALKLDSPFEPTFRPNLLSLIVVNRLLARPIDAGWIESVKKLENDPDPFHRAQWLAVFGSADQAISNLAEAISETPNHVRNAPFCPAFHDLRHDPRFIQLTTGKDSTE